jgi:hypothetical protein
MSDSLRQFGLRYEVGKLIGSGAMGCSLIVI